MAVNHLDNFIDHISHEKKLSKHTTLSYQTDLLQFEEFVSQELSDPDLLNINHLIIRSWIAQLLDSGLSPRSVNRKLSSLKSFYKYLLKNSYSGKKTEGCADLKKAVDQGHDKASGKMAEFCK